MKFIEQAVKTRWNTCQGIWLTWFWLLLQNHLDYEMFKENFHPNQQIQRYLIFRNCQQEVFHQLLWREENLIESLQAENSYELHISAD